MKNRRKFLHLSALGFLSPMMLPLIKPYIIPEESKKGIVKQPEDGETFFVRENTPITIQISKKMDSADSISICTEEIQPGAKIATHKHLNEDEYFTFLKGTGSIKIDGLEFPVKPGTSGLVPRATWHSIQNTSSESLIFTFGYSPAGFEDFFRQIGTPKGIPFKAKTAEEILSFAEKYGIVYKPK
ncbi:MAG TPA: cupin domain-containing protein [Puia sp.]|jgi:mannose-6-phosphate isomerase-like protein (cupin superfamily)|nr:cupin domain-containing protein [Puia sp.]